jgi:hypothetical protein
MGPHRLVRSQFRAFGLVGVVGMALVLGAVAAAWGGTSAKGAAAPQFVLRAIPASQVHPSGQVPRIRNANGTSSNWSGYAVFPNPQTQNSSKNGKGKGNGKPSGGSSPTFSDVTGSWVVPKVTDSSSAHTYSSTWVGLDGYADGTVEQIGTEQDWSNGGPHYLAWFEMYPKWAYEIVGFPVSPGDTISAEVVYGTKGSFTLTITNESVLDGSGNPVTFSTTQRAPSAQRLSAEWVEEAPWSGGVLPLADFGVVHFSDCSATMAGHTGAINDSQWQYDAIAMETSDGTVKADPGDLSAGGTAFSVTWYNE